MANLIEISKPLGKSFRSTAPACWKELTKRELLIWSKICLKRISLAEALGLTAVFFYKIPKKLVQDLHAGQILQLGESLSFLHHQNFLSRWLIPSFKIGFNRYYGPSDALFNLSIAEYHHTELAYQQYLKTNDSEALVLLVATLYRKKRNGLVDDDIRESPSEHGLLKRMKTFKKLKKHFLQAIFLNYEGCRNCLQKKYAKVFRPIDEKNPKEQSDLDELIESLSGAKFGTYQQTAQTKLHRFFRHLQNTLEQAEENQKQILNR